MKNSKARKLRWFEAFAPTAQMFRGLGKGLGRGRGPRLAETPKADRGRWIREMGLNARLPGQRSFREAEVRSGRNKVHTKA